jgi:Domain of unknown function (DUF6285)
MRDLPSGAALLALGRDILLHELAPLLPEERRPEALLVARCMAIAEREAATEEAPACELRVLYGSDQEPAELLRRFARDLRIGAFEDREAAERAARAVLWRLTIKRLRRSNPQFLAANGLR